jgi:diguanylate cyclase (GGDEF)-like protein
VSFKVLSLLSWFATAILFLLRITSDLMKELSTQCLTDPLTGVSNRRGFFTVAEGIVRNASPALPATLLLLDIDHFKRVNDTFGHSAGDRVIQALATLLRENAKDTSCVVGRIGGEEFVALLPATNVVSGRAFAEGIRTAFAECVHKGVPSSYKVTASIGLTESLGEEGIHSVIERADGALYRAKREGRNRVQVSATEGKVRLDAASQGPVAKPHRHRPSAA